MAKNSIDRIRSAASKLKRKLFGEPTPEVKMVHYTEPEIKWGQEKTTKTIAVIGAGRQGRAVCKAAADLDGLSVAAIADVKSSQLEQIKQDIVLKSTRFYTDADELLTKEKADLLSISTWAPSHIDLAKKAIATGCTHILIEKPIGICVHEVDEFLEQARSKQIKLAVNHSRRWSMDYMTIERYLRQGSLGKICSVYVAFGKGGLAMNGTHFVDIIRFLIGFEAAWVLGKLNKPDRANKRGEEFCDPPGYGFIEFTNGARAFLDFSDDMVRKESIIVIKTENGRIEIDERKRRWSIHDQFGVHNVGFVDPTRSVGYMRRTLAELLSDTAPRATGSDGVKALEIVIAMHISNDNGQMPVALPLTPAQRNTTINFP